MKPITQAMRLERRQAAEIRQAAYAALSRKEKLARLQPGGSRRQSAKEVHLALKGKTP